MAKIDILTETDAALAYRVMQRVKNLSPTEAMIAKLCQLKGKAQVETPLTLQKVFSADKIRIMTKRTIRNYLKSSVLLFWHLKFKM